MSGSNKTDVKTTESLPWKNPHCAKWMKRKSVFLNIYFQTEYDRAQALKPLSFFTPRNEFHGEWRHIFSFDKPTYCQRTHSLLTWRKWKITKDLKISQFLSKSSKQILLISNFKCEAMRQNDLCPWNLPLWGFIGDFFLQCMKNIFSKMLFL